MKYVILFLTLITSFTTSAVITPKDFDSSTGTYGSGDQYAYFQFYNCTLPEINIYQ